MHFFPVNLFDQLLRNQAIIKHHFRMIIPDELLLCHLAACPVNGISVYFGNSEIFVSFFMEMMILFQELIILRKFSFASQLSVQLSAFTPDEKLDILVCIILKAKVYVIITDGRSGTERNSFSMIRSKGIGMSVKFNNTKRAVQNKQVYGVSQNAQSAPQGLQSICRRR